MGSNDKEDFFRRRAFLFLGETRERSSMIWELEGVEEEREEGTAGEMAGGEGSLRLEEGGDADVEGVG